ncbi:MAG: DinB family protein [Chloroflexi bacterium]|nr:DinB family protein [Chloroflexota bacterium]
MSRLEFLRFYFPQLHGGFQQALDGLTLEQLHWRPSGQTNSVAFVLWHCARTEDNVAQFVLQRRPTLWVDGGWDKRFGLDPRAQGTGMTAEEVSHIRFPSAEEFRTYMTQAFQATEQYISTLQEEALDQKARIRRATREGVQETPIWEVLGTTLLTHGYSHLGELWVLRSLQGLQGASF